MEEVAFSFAPTRESELIRVRHETEAEVGLPKSFFGGPSHFGSLIAPQNSMTGIPMDSRTGGEVSVTSVDAGTGAGRSVVESDIWKVDGDTLYFFNQARALQLIDISTPDRPVLTGELPEAGWGEEMYVLPSEKTSDTAWLALLTQPDCDDTAGVLLVRADHGVPILQTNLPVAGQILASRLVGNSLYIATSHSTNVWDGISSWSYQTETRIVSFDLTDPRNPIVRSSLSLEGAPDTINATDSFLFVALSRPATTNGTADWTVPQNHILYVYDISDAFGNVKALGQFDTFGRVDNKLKLGVSGDVLTVVSQTDGFGKWVKVTGDQKWEWTPPAAAVETFSLKPPLGTGFLGRTVLVTNETLYGTRLVGDRAYVITYHQVDPLWIIDLTDPTNPVVRGKLQIPGYSTYLQLLGDRLVALGVEGSKTVLQLFDVSNDAELRKLSQATLGESWSWSSASYDDKAFQLFPERNLILVPWQGQMGQSWFQGMQLVDLAQDKLTLRGVIDHQSQARRATVYHDRVLSLSASELITADITDRDTPRVVNTLGLSWEVDKVFVVGRENLLEIRNQDNSPAISLVSTRYPEVPISTIQLGTNPIVGLEFQNGTLYIQQMVPVQWTQIPALETNELVVKVPVPPLLITTTNEVVVEIPQPPQLAQVPYTNIVNFPPSPDGTEQAPETNIVFVTVKIPQPSKYQTNEVVQVTKYGLPPRLETNSVISTNWYSAPKPTSGTLTVVEVTTNTLQISGTVATEAPTNYSGQLFHPVWVTKDQLVWSTTSASSPRFYSPFGLATAAIAVGDDSGYPIWGAMWSPVSMLMAFDHSNKSIPKQTSTLTLGLNENWNSVSGTFAENGKLYLGHGSSAFNAGIKTDLYGNPTDGAWEYHRYLDVIDYSVPAEPILRPPVEIPGDLSGISHGGGIVYAQGSNPGDYQDTTNYLHALGYDGTKASLVASLPIQASIGYPFGPIGITSRFAWFPTARPIIRPSGTIVVVGHPPGTNELTNIEFWKLADSGVFARSAAVALKSGALETHLYSDLLAVLQSGMVTFIDIHDPDNPQGLGSSARPCSLGIDLDSCDANADWGVWVPRGASGVWNIAIGR
jgi:hypothetical protein